MRDVRSGRLCVSNPILHPNAVETREVLLVIGNPNKLVGVSHGANRQIEIVNNFTGLPESCFIVGKNIQARRI